ncbi:MAG: hypothetical protein V3S46_03145 [Nitrospinota bacterium]
MIIIYTDHFKKDFKQLPKKKQQLFKKKIAMFMENIRHPSLRVKKMSGTDNRWEASIDMFYRFTFEKHEDHYFLRRIGPHDDVLKKP